MFFNVPFMGKYLLTGLCYQTRSVQSDLDQYCLRKVSSVLHPNFLTNDKILDWSKIKAFADDKNKKKMMIFVKKLLEKEKIMVTSTFSLDPQCFQKACY